MTSHGEAQRRNERAAGCVHNAMWISKWGVCWALSAGFLVHGHTRWYNGRGLVRTCVCGSGGCDMTATATWQIVPA